MFRCFILHSVRRYALWFSSVICLILRTLLFYHLGPVFPVTVDNCQLSPPVCCKPLLNRFSTIFPGLSSVCSLLADIQLACRRSLSSLPLSFFTKSVSEDNQRLCFIRGICECVFSLLSPFNHFFCSRYSFVLLFTGSL